MALKPLKVFITGDDTDLQKALGRTGRGLKNVGVAAAAASAVVVGALAAMAVQGIRTAKEIEVLSQRANATPEAFQKMAAGARTVGIDTGKLSDILQDMNDRVGDFVLTGAGPMADFFEKIAPRVGVTADQFRRLSGPEALQLYVDSLQKANLGQQEMTFFMEAISSDATQLIPLLRDGGVEMQRLGEAASNAGQIISSEMLDGIVAADNAMQQISGTFQAMQMRLAAELAPALEFVATRFQELAQSEAAQRAINRVVSAFGDLADVILSEDFLGAAVSGLELLSRTASIVADGMVTLSQNVEVVTVAAGGLAIGMAALGGPLTLVAGLLGVSLVALSSWRGKAEDAAAGSDAAREAQDALNAALGVFYQTAAPAAADAAIKLANDNYKQAESALAAAEAEIAKRRAQQEAFAGGVQTARRQGLQQRADEQAAEAVRELAAAESQLADARRSLDRTARSVTGSDFTPPKVQTPESVTLPDVETPEFDTPGIGAPSVGGAGAVEGQMQARLDALITGLQTERETVQAWYEQGRETLREALEAEKITEEEYRTQRERLEKEHAERMGEIREAERQTALQGMQGMFGDLSTLMRTENEKLFKIGQAAAIANATVSGYEAAVEAWNKGMKVGGPPVAAAFTAASLARTGVLISQIASQSAGGGGSSGGGGGGGGSASGGGAGAAPAPRQIYIDAQGDYFSRQSFEDTLTNILQDRLDMGDQLIFGGSR